MTAASRGIGPLTTVWTPDPSCYTESQVYHFAREDPVNYWVRLDAQRFPTMDVACPKSTLTDIPVSNCRPPVQGDVVSGFYSPGLYCPEHWTPWQAVWKSDGRIYATADAEGGIDQDTSLLEHETAVACCPPGYHLSGLLDVICHPITLPVTTFNGTFCACQSDICVSKQLGISLSSSESGAPLSLSLDQTVDVIGFITEIQVGAPAVQLRWQPSDNPKIDIASISLVLSPSTSSILSHVTQVSTQTQTSSSSPEPKHSNSNGTDAMPPPSGLSGQAKVGLGVGLGLGGLALLIICAIFTLRYRRKRLGQMPRPGQSATDEVVPEGKPELPGTSVAVVSGQPRHVQPGVEDIDSAVVELAGVEDIDSAVAELAGLSYSPPRSEPAEISRAELSADHYYSSNPPPGSTIIPIPPPHENIPSVNASMDELLARQTRVQKEIGELRQMRRLQEEDQRIREEIEALEHQQQPQS